MTKYSQKNISYCRVTDKRGKWNRSTIRFGLVLGIVLLVGGYIVETSLVSVKGYDMGTLQKQITDLKRENQRLQIQIASYSSMESIEKRVADLHMVPSGKAQYLSAVGTAVARR